MYMISITPASRGQLYIENGGFYETDKVKKEFRLSLKENFIHFNLIH